MAINNKVLFNAALSGCVAGAMSKRRISDAVAADYANIVNAAAAFAAQVDADVPTDAQLQASGATVLPSTAALVNAQLSKTQLMTTLCKGYWEECWTADTTQTDYTTPAAAIAALYTQTIASFSTG